MYRAVVLNIYNPCFLGMSNTYKHVHGM